MLILITRPAAYVDGINAILAIFDMLSAHQIEPMTAFILALLGILAMRKA